MESRRKVFTARAALLGVLLSIIYSSVNLYLNLNFGWSFSFTTLTILLAYLLFQGYDSSEGLSEMGVAVIASSSGLTMGFTIAQLICLREDLRDLWIPGWIIPSYSTIAARSLAISEWITPILYLLLIAASSSLVGYLFALMTYKPFLSDERLTFPTQLASATLAESTVKGGQAAKMTWLFVLGAAAVTFTQYVLKLFRIEATEIDLTPILPSGFVFAIALSLGFTAIGILISAKASLTLFMASVFTYLFLTPLAVAQGILPASRNTMETYNALLMKVTVSPVLGMMILGGITLSLVGSLRRWARKEKSETSQRAGYIELYRHFFLQLVKDKRGLLAFAGLITTSLALVYVLNPFYPLPPYVSMVFYGYTLLVANFFEFIIIARMQGETGMGTGTAGIMFYDIPKFMTGYYGITAYFAMNSNAQWSGSSLMGILKVADRFRLTAKEVLKSLMISWIPAYVTTMVLVLVLWKYVGFFTSTMPCISLLQLNTLYKMLGTRTATGIIDPSTFLIGAVVGTVIEVATPLSMFGVALGMLLPPHYALAFGLGGAIRYFLDRRYGREFFWRKGVFATSGVLAGSMIVQVFMMIILKIVWNV